jgi:hypothetical protein
MFFDTESGLDGRVHPQIAWGQALRPEVKRGRESFRFTFASDDHGMQRRFSPSCLEILIIQSSLPEGRPRCALDRRSSSSNAFSVSFNPVAWPPGRTAATS